MDIGSIHLKSDILFAPIAGFSDVGFRHLAAKYGAGMTYTELVSAKGLVYCSKGTDELIATTDIESPCAVQLFGSDPEFMYKAAADERLKKFDIIDINMGCPVRKVFNNGEGSALMQYPSLITEVVSAVREGGKRPVTVKMRAGIEVGKPLAVQAALAAERGGASAITVHPRFREQYYSGYADHSITRDVKQAVGIPVIANGDITDLNSLKAVAERSKADAFMIARGALGRPWIFAELRGVEVKRSDKEDILTHIDILRRYLSDKVVANQMKMHLCYYAKGTPYAKSVRCAAAGISDIDGLMRVVDEYFK